MRSDEQHPTLEPAPSSLQQPQQEGNYHGTDLPAALSRAAALLPTAAADLPTDVQQWMEQARFQAF